MASICSQIDLLKWVVTYIYNLISYDSNLTADFLCMFVHIF